MSPAREPRRILLMTYEYPPIGGGGAVIAQDLARELAEQMDVTVLTTHVKDLEREERHGRLRVVRTPVLLRRDRIVASLPSLLSFFPSSLRAGHRLLSAEPYDLVHSSFAVPSGPSGLVLARRFGLPHLLSIQGGDIYDPSKRLSPHRIPLVKQTVRWVLSGSDRVISNSADVARRAREIYVDRPVDVIPLAVRKVETSGIPRKELSLGLRPEHVVLVALGRLVARKGLDQLIEIVGKLGDPQVRLVIVGDGPERAALESQTVLAGLADRVHFAGFVSEERKNQILAASDLMVSTSLHEGFGIALLEGLQHGLPVVCYDRGGQVDFLDPSCSRLVPFGHPDQLLSELKILCDAPALRAELGAQGRLVAERFGVPAFARRNVEIYREVLAGRPAAARGLSSRA